MSVDYLVSSLPTLRFGENAPITEERFCAAIAPIEIEALLEKWHLTETLLKNYIAEARAAKRGHSGDATKYLRATDGCSVYWRNRIDEAFKEIDAFKRDEALDRVFWDAAGELTEVMNPLGKGALATYAARLRIVLKRSKISKDAGNAAFDRLTAETKIEFNL